MYVFICIYVRVYDIYIYILQSFVPLCMHGLSGSIFYSHSLYVVAAVSYRACLQIAFDQIQSCRPAAGAGFTSARRALYVVAGVML